MLPLSNPVTPSNDRWATPSTTRSACAQKNFSVNEPGPSRDSPCPVAPAPAALRLARSIGRGCHRPKGRPKSLCRVYSLSRCIVSPPDAPAGRHTRGTLPLRLSLPLSPAAGPSRRVAVAVRQRYPRQHLLQESHPILNRVLLLLLLLWRLLLLLLRRPLLWRRLEVVLTVVRGVVVMRGRSELPVASASATAILAQLRRGKRASRPKWPVRVRLVMVAQMVVLLTGVRRAPHSPGRTTRNWPHRRRTS